MGNTFSLEHELEKSVRLIYLMRSVKCWVLLFDERGSFSCWIEICTIIPINLSTSNAAYMRQWTGSALPQVMARRLFVAKPLPEPNVDLLLIGPFGTNFGDIRIKIQTFSLFSFMQMYLKLSSANSVATIFACSTVPDTKRSTFATNASVILREAVSGR